MNAVYLLAYENGISMKGAKDLGPTEGRRYKLINLFYTNLIEFLKERSIFYADLFFVAISKNIRSKLRSKIEPIKVFNLF